MAARHVRNEVVALLLEVDGIDVNQKNNVRKNIHDSVSLISRIVLGVGKKASQSTRFSLSMASKD